VDTGEKQVIAELARAQVAQVAPAELPLFRATSEAFLRDPQAAARGRRAGGDLLGFGAGDAVQFLTPVILAVMSEVVTFLVAEIRKHLHDESSATVAALVKRLFKPLAQRAAGDGGAGDHAEGGTATGGAATGGSATPVPALTAQQIERVYTLALEKAKLFNLADAQAQLLADSVVGNLVRAP
jgi:hypothetical protein